MKNLSVLFYVLLIFVGSVGFTQAPVSRNEIGAVLSLAEGEKLFGQVRKFVEMDIIVLSNSVTRAEKFILFGLYQEGGVVAVDDRKVVFPDISITDEFVLHLYSKSVVQKLLAKEPVAAKFFLEERERAFTVRINNWIMEFSNPCPPFCRSE